MSNVTTFGIDLWFCKDHEKRVQYNSKWTDLDSKPAWRGCICKNVQNKIPDVLNKSVSAKTGCSLQT